MKHNALDLRKRAHANELYKVANDLRRCIFVNGGQPDDVMKVAQAALRIVRIIDNPILDKKTKK